MDRYLSTSTKQKNAHEFTTLGRAVCIIGKTGTGKTWLVHNTLENFIEITPEILKSKQDTLEFLAKIKNTQIPVVLDEYECVYDLVGIRELVQLPTSGLFVVLSQIPVKFDFEIHVYNIPRKTPEEIQKIFPRADPTVVATCGGDLRVVAQSVDFKTDVRDFFQSPRDFLTSLVSKKSSVNPVDFIGHTTQEPGNIASILHENYLDGSGDTALIAEMMSQADIIETRVYKGEWEFLNYFNLWGCVLPAVELGHTLGSKLRPGSTWTKYQNMCMRTKRIESLSRRLPGKRLCYDTIIALREHADHENGDILKEYGLKPQDIDVLNHLSPYRKLKPKTVLFLKKCLAESVAAP